MKATDRIHRKLVSFFCCALALGESFLAYKLFGWRNGKPPLLSLQELDQLESGSFVSGHSLGGSLLKSPEPAHETIRVVTWNLQYGRKYQKILEALTQSVPADIYLVQEVDCHARRSGYRDIARLLAQELSLHYVFAVEFQELTQAGSQQPALCGQAILSRFRILHPRLLRFRHQPADWSSDFFQPRRGSRIALAAEIQVGDRTVVIYNTHLESRGTELGRTRQMHEVLSDVRDQGYPGPILIGGDFNTREGASSPVIEAAAREGFQNILAGGTGEFPTSATRGCLDWILTRGLAPASASVNSKVRASDHKPVSARLRQPVGHR